MPNAITRFNNVSVTTNVATYPALFRRVKETLLDGQHRIEAQKVQTYWDTGRLIQAHILQNKDRAEYGTEAVNRLSEDLSVSASVLRRCVQFYQTYPDQKKFAAQRKFTWAHYQQLIPVADDKQRARFEALVEKGDISYRELASRIKASRASEPVDAETSPSPSPSPSPLIPLRGTLYTYQIFKRKILGTSETELVLDLGFSNYRNVDSLQGFVSGDIVESCPKMDSYRFVKGSRSAKDLYTYNAYVEKVIDGDTLKAHIDLGFETWTRQSLRLRGIDCPEKGTKAGDAAMAFVQSYLKEADRIIIRSSRSDKFDRYLADVFLTSSTSGVEEVCLNGLLLEKGHAERWEG